MISGWSLPEILFNNRPYHVQTTNFSHLNSETLATYVVNVPESGSNTI